MKEIRIIPCLDIKDSRVVKGINFVNWVSSNLKKISDDELTFSPYQRNAKTVKKHLQGKGKVSRSELLRASHLSSREFSEAVKTLLESEEITSSTEKNPETKRAVTYYASSQ